MLTKARLKEQIEEFSLDELIERLILVDKIERGIKQSENGETLSESELDKEIER